MTNLQKLKEKIWELIPEIRPYKVDDLRVGDKVIFRDYYWVVSQNSGSYIKLISPDFINDKKHNFLFAKEIISKDAFSFYPSSKTQEKEKLELYPITIIGRDIRLADILKALHKLQIVFPEDIYRIFMNWDLSNDFIDLQSKPTIDLLCEVMGVKADE